jgi:5-methylcytosine-specific restriction endonuclease McrA
MPATSVRWTHAHRVRRAQLLKENRSTFDGLCNHCWSRPASVADHQPPLCEFEDEADWVGVLVASCRRCSDLQGSRLGHERRRRLRPPENRQTRDWLS